jgi:hypothetical protein
VIPASVDSDAAAFNGSLQGRLARKLAVNVAGDVAVVNSSVKLGISSRVWLTRADAAGSGCRRF